MAKVSIEDALVFRFPDIHEDAVFSIDFQRTLRVPDDGRTHLLPPGLGSFPLRNVDDYAERIPAKWAERGGGMLPMYQSEALWLSFGGWYPCAVKISTGGVCCLTGGLDDASWSREPQNYLVVPEQPWLDGYNTGKDEVRQFVAAPLDHAASVEKQIRGETTQGGMQVEVRPMTAEAWAKHKPAFQVDGDLVLSDAVAGAAEMGFTAGGSIRQEIYEDPYAPDEWSAVSVSCNIWVANSLVWRGITGEKPPTEIPGPEEYRKVDLPWFDYYGDAEKLPPSQVLAALKSYKGGNESVDFGPQRIVEIRKKAGLGGHEVRVRENN